MGGSLMLVVVGGVVLILISVMVIYNRLIRYRNYCQNSFAQIEVQLTRRYDLIPNIVAVVKEYLQYEAQVLQRVISARNLARECLSASQQSIGEALTMQSIAGAEGVLNGALGGLLATVEGYPELQASEQMRLLMDELVHTENRIAFARQGYNDSVMSYNILKESFPNNLISYLFRFGAMSPLDLEFGTHNPRYRK